MSSHGVWLDARLGMQDRVCPSRGTSLRLEIALVDSGAGRFSKHGLFWAVNCTLFIPTCDFIVLPDLPRSSKVCPPWTVMMILRHGEIPRCWVTGSERI